MEGASRPADETVWAVTCFATRAGFRRRGVSRALARASVDFARDRGARALEAYPLITEPGQEIAWGETHVGTRGIFADAGFTEVSHPTLRRVVMRIDFHDDALRRRVALMVPPKDTSAAAFARLLDELRALGPQQRLRLAAEMSDELREIARAGIRSRHPGSRDQQVSHELEALLLGEELATAARRSRLAPGR